MSEPFKVKLFLDKGESFPVELVELYELVVRRVRRLNPRLALHALRNDNWRHVLRAGWKTTADHWAMLCLTGPYPPDSPYGVWTASLHDYVRPHPDDHVTQGREAMLYFDVCAPDFFARLTEAIRATGIRF